MASKKKAKKEVIAVAQEIASVVEPVKMVKTVEVSQEPVKEEATPETIQVAKVAPKAVPPKSMKVKATASVRGQFHNMRYEIKQGEVYTLRTDLAEWLISQGRAI